MRHDEQRHPFLDWPAPLAIAHRGGAAEGLENTMAAFRMAASIGYQYFETDVHLTADGVVVAFHDDDLMRTCGQPGRISLLPWRDVASVRVHGLEPIPRLIDLLEEFPNARINIDCKSDAVVDALGDTLAQAGSLRRVCIGSFSDRRLWRIRRRFGDDVCTSVGPGELAFFKIGGRIGASVNAVQVPTSWKGIPIVDDRFVRRCHADGLALHVWTIDDRSEMERLLDLGVDGIMTDRPQVLRDLLIERGEWH